ncbi:MAG: hypothetical protein D3M94_14370 [Rhodocyclales bacterium GT-UBC]|nr:MAG: hypothetical protein D3M94_14370 [Rhodocyclales bacterium GT-UBC]
MEADIAFHLCLANTGWNPAVLYSLDASEEFLRTHPKNPNQYQLIGNKARAGGTEQFVSGLWKSTSGPGYIIKAWLERTASLRKQLVTNLEEQRAHYLNLIQQGASLDDQVTELAKVQRLEEGCRCVWLYVETGGDIGWLNQRTTNVLNLNGKRSTYLEILLDRLNRERIARGEPTIPSVTASDFRDIFALYVWRISSGNILAVKRALNHARLDTSVRYTSNNILNSERDEEVRTFLDHLFAELGQGRIDITILAHLQRYGKVTDEMEQRLTDYRALERSRVGVACKDPFNPPKSMQPESSISRICSRQRCLLCKEHAVILPESLPGIAMRMEELEAIKGATPAGDWFKSQFPDEFKNGQDVLRLFPADAVRAERLRWAQAISDGSHHVPGLNLVSNERGIT